MPTESQHARAQAAMTRISTFTQTVVSAAPVVVAGTGATIPHGLPSMHDLSQHLVDTLDPSLPGWEATRSHLEDGLNLESALLKAPLDGDSLRAAVNSTWSLVNERDIELLRQLMNDAPRIPLANLLAFLLQSTAERVDVLTTNYDRVIEYAAAQAQAICVTGTRMGHLGGFAEQLLVGWPKASIPSFEGMVRLLKVHGSLDWFESPSGSFIASRNEQVVPKGLTPLIVTPGDSKFREVLTEPFRTILSAADQVLASARSIMAIGFGFNDEHIQPKLVQRMRTANVPTLVLARTLTAAAKDLFLSQPPLSFLLLERSEMKTGTTMYHPGALEGETIADSAYWDLPRLLELGGIV